MLRTRYKKVLRDITADFSKSVVLILSITIGLFGIGIVLGAFSVLSREMSKNYLISVPASATLDVESDSIPKQLLLDLESIEGIKKVERRSTVITQMKNGSKWIQILLFVIDDFNEIKMGKMVRETGAWPPLDGTVLLERSTLSFIRSGVGKSITVKTDNGTQEKLEISGKVFDPGMAPTWQGEIGYGYVTAGTLINKNLGKGITELKILVDDTLSMDENKIKSVSTLVADKLESNGYSVHEIQIPPPGMHPHQSLMNMALLILFLFGLMLVVLASVLVSNAISTLMIKQIREIAVMKTIGAGSAQISGLYMTMIIILSAIATTIGIISSPFVAQILIQKFAGGFNLNLYDTTIPAWVFFVQLATGILIPLLVSTVPILKGGRITVREALGNYGVSKKRFGKNRIEKIISKAHFLSDLTTLSLRNVFRNSSRLVVSVLLLAVGGAIFLTALNASKSWEGVSENIYSENKFDLDLRTNEPVKDDAIISKIASINGVKKIEKWGYVSASVVTSKEKYQFSQAYPDRGHGTTTLFGLPALSTELVNISIIDGRGLNNENTNDILLPFTDKYKVGDKVKLSIEGETSEWNIVGFYDPTGFNNALGYTSLNALNNVTHSEGSYNMLRIATEKRSTRPIVDIQKLLERENFSAESFTSIDKLIDQIEEHIVIIVDALIAMGILMALVGAIGLMSVISMNILERTKELGVMRAIGATPQKIVRLILGEGIIIAIISFFFAIILSFITTYLAAALISSAKGPVDVSISLTGIVVWIILVLLSSVIATIFPAWRANRMSVREALTY